MQHPALQRRDVVQLRTLAQGRELALQSSLFKAAEVETVAAVHGFNQQLCFELGDAVRAVDAIVRHYQCPSQTRISDSSCATSTGLVM